MSVEPDTDGFEEKLKAKLGDMDAELHVGLDDGATEERLDEIDAKMDDLDHKTAHPKVDSSSAEEGAGWMGLLVTAAAAVAPVAITAGVGLAAFGALAVPAIKKVIDYQTLLGQHTATSGQQAKAMWATMDAGERQLATGLRTLAGSYTEVASAVEPQVIDDFNTGVRETNAILPELTGMAEAGGRALGAFFAQFGGFLQGGTARQFFSFVTDQAGPDMAAFGRLLDGVLSGVFGLTEALNPLAKILVNDLGGLADLIGDVARGTPWLVQFGAGGALAALSVSKLVAAGKALKETSIAEWASSTFTAMKTAATTTAGAAAAQKALAAAAVEAGTAETVFAVDTDGVAVATTAAAAAMTEATTAEVAMAAGMAALDAVNPLAWAGLAVAAFVGLGVAMDHSASPADQLVSSLKAQDQATGYNIAGYQRLSAQLGDTAAQMNKTIAASNGVTGSQTRFSEGAEAQALAVQGIDAAQVQAETSARNLAAGLSRLESTYGLTRTQAEQLASAAGVTAGQLAAGGKTAAAAMTKIYNYSLAGAQATTQTTQLGVEAGILAGQMSTAADKVTALTNAYNNLVSPQLDLMNDTVAFRQAQETLAKALTATGGRLGDSTTAEQNATTSATAATQAAFANSEAIEKVTGSNTRAIGPLQRLLDQFEKAGLKGAGAAKLIRELREQIAALKSKSVDIDVVFGHSGTTGPDPSGQSLPGVYPGGVGAAEGGVLPGYEPGRDTVRATLSKGEGILVPEAVRGLGAGFVYAANKFYAGSRIGRGNKGGGFAEGGITAAARFGFPQDVFNIRVDAAAIDPGATAGVLAGLASTATSSAAQTRASEAATRVRDFEDAGRKLADAFSRGTVKTLAQVKTEASDAIAAIQQYYTGRARHDLVGAIRVQTRALEDLARHSARIEARITAERAYASNITSGLASYSSLSGLATPTAGGTPAQLGASVKAQLAAKLASLHQFFTLLGQLRTAGVDKALIAQVVALGPDAGIPYAQALLSGGQALISDLNSEEKQITGLDKKIGQRAAEVQYGQSITSGFLSSLRSRRAEVDAEMRRMGDQLARELARDFGVPLRDLPRRARRDHHDSGREERQVTVNFYGRRPNTEELARVKRELAMALGGG